MTPYIRRAALSELHLLAAVNQSAVSTFAQIEDLVPECSQPPLPLELLETFEVLVAVEHEPISLQIEGNITTNTEASGSKSVVPENYGRTGEVILGFIALRRLDEAVFIAMIGVREDFQKNGIGTLLLSRAIADAKREGARMMSLTTFADVPWNGPWYRRMGFVELSVEEVEVKLGPEHVAMFQESRGAHERPTWRWIVMAQQM